MGTFMMKDNEISFGFNMRFYPVITLEDIEEKFESKEELICFLKRELMESIDYEAERLFNDIKNDFDNVFPYYNLEYFEITDSETNETVNLVDSYKGDNKDFFENFILPTIAQNTNEEV